jgi:diaminohydroxyphosphoribosylaminopyrimidine deaminase / 5-amino-6-(5-phosphoribosylamino)uracil reductase
MPAKKEEFYMRKAFAMALKAKGVTSPDPLVGAVIVKNNRIIASGYHAYMGTPHAESWALSKAGEKAKGSTLYVNLEPCCHYGNTPPCTDYIIRAGIKKVVSAMQDPNPLVAGKGHKQLEKAGIKVVKNILNEEALKINEAFIKHITTKRPFVILKSALSLDGKIANSRGDSKWISSLKARKFTHQLRNEIDAVMVGIGTVLKDNPKLTVRLVKKVRNPIRIILDSEAKIPLNSKILNTKVARTILVISRSVNYKKLVKLENMGVEILTVKSKNGKLDLAQLMDKLGKMKITSVLVEGGAKISASALEHKIVDKIIYVIAPKIIGGHCSIGAIAGIGANTTRQAIKLFNICYKKIGSDILIEGYLKQ